MSRLPLSAWLILLALALVLACGYGPARDISPGSTPAPPLNTPEYNTLEYIDSSDYYFSPPAPNFFTRPATVKYTPPSDSLTFYRISVIQNGRPWTFTAAVPPTDTLWWAEFWDADSLQVGVEACNYLSESRGIIWSAVHIVQPETVEVRLVVTSGTDYSYIALPPSSPLASGTASDLASHIEKHTSPPAAVLSVSYWNAEAQAFTEYSIMPVIYGDFLLRERGVYRIEIDRTTTWKMPVHEGGIQKWRWRASR